MPQYQSPGVYIQEVPPASVPFGRVSTSTAGFIGYITTQAGNAIKGTKDTLMDSQGNRYGRGSISNRVPFPDPAQSDRIVQVPVERKLDPNDITKGVYRTNVVVLPAPEQPQLFTSFASFALQY